MARLLLMLILMACAGCVGIMPNRTADPSGTDVEAAAGADWLRLSLDRLRQGIDAIEPHDPVEAASLDSEYAAASADCEAAEQAVAAGAPEAKSIWRRARESIGRLARACLPIALKYGLGRIFVQAAG